MDSLHYRVSNKAPESYHVGVDLGQSRDPTAVALVARRESASIRDPASWEWESEYEYQIRGLRRLPLGMTYPKIVEQIELLTRTVPEDATRELVVDATGVGAAVVDLLREQFRNVSMPLVPVIFTAGEAARCERGAWRVPKKDLVHSLLVTFQEDKLRIPENHELAAVLIGELKTMALKITGQDHTSYEAWRENEHDDLVFALAMATWRARKCAPQPLGGRQRLLW
ncbi:MAG: hypothetical protein R2729_14180 [Bryobacteraceae bacterium]